MGGGKQPKNTTQTTKTEPWAGQQPYLLDLYKQAAGRSQDPAAHRLTADRLARGHGLTAGTAGYNQYVDNSMRDYAAQGGGLKDKQFYPGQTYADPSQQTQDAMSALYARGGGSQQEAEASRLVSDLMAGKDQTGDSYLDSTARGDYLHGGAGFNAALDAAQRRIMPQLASQFSGAGRYGSGLHGIGQAQALSDSFAGLYGQERGHQEAARHLIPQMRNARMSLGLGMVPQLSALDYRNLQARQGVGQHFDQLAQSKIDEARERWEFGQNAPYERLQAISNIIQGQGSMGSTQTQTGPNPNQRNRFAGAIGGGLAGMGAAGALGITGPVGWGVAGLGALAGLL